MLRQFGAPHYALPPFQTLPSLCSLRTIGNLRVVTEVARSLDFPKRLHAIAQRIIDGMAQGGHAEYNGVHLRIERDARDWAMIMGGAPVVWHSYIKTMKSVGFDNATRLYVASGMLTYGAGAGAWVGGWPLLAGPLITALIPLSTCFNPLFLPFPADMDRTIAYLQLSGVCNEVHYKERYISKYDLDGALSTGFYLARLPT